MTYDIMTYGPFSLCVIHKEGLCPSSDDDDDHPMTDQRCLTSAIARRCALTAGPWSSTYLPIIMNFQMSPFRSRRAICDSTRVVLLGHQLSYLEKFSSRAAANPELWPSSDPAHPPGTFHYF
jgi:hypothetical protein